MPNSERLLTAVQTFLVASNEEEITTAFQEYPELLDEEVDILFEAVIDDAYEQGKEAIMQAFIERYQVLRIVRSKLSKLRAQQQDGDLLKNAIEEALTTESPGTEFLAPANAFFEASNEEEVGAVFQKYPELLKPEESDHIFEALIENALKYGENDFAKVFTQRFQQLKDIRIKLKEHFAQQYAQAIVLQEIQEEQAAKTAKPNPELLLVAMQAFLEVYEAKKAYTLFQTYPELLNEEMNPLFEAKIASAQKQGDLKLVKFLKERHRMLKNLRKEARKIFKKDSFHRTRH
jgi:hypothetical protein